MKWSGRDDRRPALAAVPPLAPVTRSSTIIMPVAIAHTAIRDALERAAPPDFRKARDSLSAFRDARYRLVGLARAIHGLGRPEGSPYRRAVREHACEQTSLRLRRRLAGLARRAAGFAREPVRRKCGTLPPETKGRTRPSRAAERKEQRAEIRGSATLIARPTLLPKWRVEPNLTSQVTIADASLSVMGMKLSVPDSSQAAARSCRQ